MPSTDRLFENFFIEVIIWKFSVKHVHFSGINIKVGFQSSFLKQEQEREWEK